MRSGGAPHGVGGAGRRTLAVWCPDWPMMAAGVAATEPAAVVHANRVVACTPAARAAGVRPGLRRREAQGRCPELRLVPHDPARDAREFEPVLAAVEALTPHLEVSHPGAVTFPCRGAARYHGGEASLARLVAAAVDEVLGARGRCQVSLADGRFAAELAARHPVPEGTASRSGAPDTPARGRHVPPGKSRAFLAELPVSVLGAPDLADLLNRLGLRTLGDVAALPVGLLSERFGEEGVRAHHLASGRDGLPGTPRRPPPDLTAQIELDPPAERVDVAAFSARSLAAELHARLVGHGLACTRIRIEAVTEHGEELARLWRADGAFTEAAAAERVRWQLDGWLSSPAAGRPTAGISLLRLTADEVAPDRGHQLTLWGGPTAGDERASRALARVQGMLGHDAVVMPVVQGGRTPGDRVALVPPNGAEPAVTVLHPRAASYAAARAAHPAGSAVARDPAAPWPGRVPSPAPATVHTDPPPAELLDAGGEVVTVGRRGLPDAAPARLWFGQGPWATISTWAGPWPADERWWDPSQHRRADRVQVVTLDGHAYLLAQTGEGWWVEATYD